MINLSVLEAWWSLSFTTSYDSATLNPILRGTKVSRRTGSSKVMNSSIGSSFSLCGAWVCWYVGVDGMVVGDGISVV